MAVHGNMLYPEDLNWVMWILAGGDWPSGMEGDIWKISEALDETADDLDGVVSGLVEALHEVMNNVDETVGRAFWRYGEKLAEQPAFYANGARQLSEMARGYSLQVQGAKISMIVQMIFAAGEIIRMWMDPFEWPLIGPFIGMMQGFVRLIFTRLAEWIAKALQVIIKTSSSFLGKAVDIVAVESVTNVIGKVISGMTKQALDEGLEEVRDDAIVQVWQKIESDKRWDWDDTLKSFQYGAAAGAFAGMLGGGVAHFKPKWAGKWTTAGLIEGATEVFVGAISIPEGGDPGDIWKGMINGLVSGAGMSALQTWKHNRDERFALEKLDGPGEIKAGTAQVKFPDLGSAAGESDPPPAYDGNPPAYAEIGNGTNNTGGTLVTTPGGPGSGSNTGGTGGNTPGEPGSTSGNASSNGNTPNEQSGTGNTGQNGTSTPNQTSTPPLRTAPMNTPSTSTNAPAATSSTSATNIPAASNTHASNTQNFGGKLTGKHDAPVVVPESTVQWKTSPAPPPSLPQVQLQWPHNDLPSPPVAPSTTPAPSTTTNGPRTNTSTSPTPATNTPIFSIQTIGERLADKHGTQPEVSHSTVDSTIESASPVAQHFQMEGPSDITSSPAAVDSMTTVLGESITAPSVTVTKPVPSTATSTPNTATLNTLTPNIANASPNLGKSEVSAHLLPTVPHRTGISGPDTVGQDEATRTSMPTEVFAPASTRSNVDANGHEDSAFSSSAPSGRNVWLDRPGSDRTRPSRQNSDHTGSSSQTPNRRTVPALFRDVARELRLTGRELELRMYHPSAGIFAKAKANRHQLQKDAYLELVDEFAGVCGETSSHLRDIMFDGDTRTNRGLRALQDALNMPSDAAIQVTGKAHSFFIEKRGDHAHLFQSYLGQENLTASFDRQVSMPATILSDRISTIIQTYQDNIDSRNPDVGIRTLTTDEQTLFNGVAFNAKDFTQPGTSIEVHVCARLASPEVQRQRLIERATEFKTEWDNIKNDVRHTVDHYIEQAMGFRLGTPSVRTGRSDPSVLQPSVHSDYQPSSLVSASLHPSNSGSNSSGTTSSRRSSNRPAIDPTVPRPSPLITMDYAVNSMVAAFSAHSSIGMQPHSLPESGVQVQLLSNPTAYPNSPPLRVSRDNTLAVVPEWVGEPHEFFATDEVIRRSNAALRQAGSLLELHADQSTTITIGHGPDKKRLSRITPRFRTGAPPPDVCRDSAGAVLGGHPDRIVMRGNGSTRVERINSGNPIEVTGSHHLAEGLANVVDHAVRTSGPVRVDPRWAVHQVRADDRRAVVGSDGPAPGQRYGSALRPTIDNRIRRTLLSDAAQQIGVNEYAWAQVGEGYCVHSINSLNQDGERGLDINYARPEVTRIPFGYHFAGVVAQSEDGETQITFENYNRTGHIDRAAVAAINENIRGLAGRFDQAEQSTTGATRTLVRELRRLDGLRRGNAPRDEVRSAERRAKNALLEASQLPSSNSLGHFKAYSRRPGESFHEANTNLFPEQPVPPVVNPLTFVVVGGHGARDSYAVQFDKGQKTLGVGENIGIRAMARGASQESVWRQNQRMAPLDITVTGHGNDWRPSHARQTSDSRANAVATELENQLRNQFTQLNAPQNLVDNGIHVHRIGAGRRVPAQTTSYGRQLSRDEARRQALIQVRRQDSAQDNQEQDKRNGFSSGPHPGAGAGLRGPGAQPEVTVDVSQDDNWRYFRGATADWMVPRDPMHRSQWEGVRHNAAVTQVSGELTVVGSGSKVEIGPDGKPKIELKSQRLSYGYAARRMEVEKSRWVLEVTANLYLDVPAEAHRADIEARVKRGVDRWFNQGYRLPNGDQFHVRVEFVDDPKYAHRPPITINANADRSKADVWTADADASKIVHEIGHGVFGLHDAYSNADFVFQDTLDNATHPGTDKNVRNRVIKDDGLMSRWYSPDGSLRPRELWMIGHNLAGGPSVIRETPLLGDPRPGPNLFTLAQDGDLDALVELANESHRESLAVLTDLAADGDVDAKRALAGFATQGDLHAIAALVKADSDAKIDGQPAVQLLGKKAKPFGRNELAAAMLTDATAQGNPEAKRIVLDAAADSDVYALGALVRAGSQETHPELDGRTAIQALADLKNDTVAVDLLIEFANDGNRDALVALAEQGNESAKYWLEHSEDDESEAFGATRPTGSWSTPTNSSPSSYSQAKRRRYHPRVGDWTQ